MARKVNWRNAVQFLTVILLVIQCFASFPAKAGDDSSPLNVNDTKNVAYSIWHLNRLPEQRTTCEITVNHAGGPTYQEVSAQCGKALAESWKSTKPCVFKEIEDINNCQGYTLVSYKVGDPKSLQPYISTLWNSKVAASNLPIWLSVPGGSRYLATDIPLVLLAGHLISTQLVDASTCPSGGLLGNGAANPCGMQTARPTVVSWQNQFDSIIYQVALQYQIPPLVLKRLFIQESQFWPATQGGLYGENGLGHITELGADTLLYWNQDFYNSLCTTVYSSLTCSAGYFRLAPRDQAILRGAVIRQVRVDCPDCASGVDIEKAAKTIPVFAQALVANANQIEQVLYSFTASSARDVSSYEDLWRFTLANYNGGVGCFKNAVRNSLRQGNALRWELVAGYFSTDCRNVLEYVDHLTDTNLATTLPEISDPVVETGVMVMDMALIGEIPVTPPTATSTLLPIMSVSPTETAQPFATQIIRLITATLPADFTPQARFYPTSTLRVTPMPGVNTPTPSLAISQTPTFMPPGWFTPTIEATASPLPQQTSLPGTQTPTFIPTGEITPNIQVTPSPTLQNSPQPVTPTQANSPTPTATPTDSHFVVPTLVETTMPSVSPTPTLTPTPLPGLYASDQILVKFFGVSVIFKDAVLASVEATEVREVNKQGLYVARVDSARLASVIQALQANILVEIAEPNYQVGVLNSPSDPLFPVQNNLEKINVLEAWNVGPGTRAVSVAIIDSGSDLQHPDLLNKIWQNPGETGTDQFGVDRRINKLDDDGNGYVDDYQGWNFVRMNSVPQDDHGHGTLVSGVIGAETDNMVGIAGIAKDALLMTLKAVNSTGIGFYSDVIESIYYAVDNHAQVINLSLGGLSDSRALKQAIDYAYSNGVLVVAAAGNSGGAKVYFPAAYANVLAISASDQNNQRAADAAFGSYLDLLAPGVSIISTQLGGDYTMFSGSSAAAAHVSGVAALMAAHSQFDSAEKISEALIHTALDLDVQGPDPQTGYGLLIAGKALQYNPQIATTATATQQNAATPAATVDAAMLNILANIPLATPTLRALPLTATPSASDPHVAHTSTTSNCAACHRSHTASGSTLRTNWPEEQVCFGCHSATGSASNIQPSFYPLVNNTTTAFYKHDTTAQVSVHKPFEGSTPTDFGGTNRHVECEDCHEPHYAARAQGSAFATPEPGSAPLLKRVENGVSGVNPVYATGIVTPTNFVALNPQGGTGPGATREFQVCVKCHSSYTALPTYIPAGWQDVDRDI